MAVEEEEAAMEVATIPPSWAVGLYGLPQSTCLTISGLLFPPSLLPYAQNSLSTVSMEWLKEAESP